MAESFQIPLSEIAAAYDTEGHVTQAGFELASRLAPKVLPPEIGACIYVRLDLLWKQVDPVNLHPNYLVALASLRVYVRELLSLVPKERMPTPTCTCEGDRHAQGCPLGSPFEVLPKTADDKPWWER